MKIHYSISFTKEYKKLPKRVKDKAQRREKVFRQDPFAPVLRTHKLKGRLFGYWAFSINYHYRVIFRFSDEDTVYFTDVGTHDIYF